MNQENRPKAIVVLSGGLDSTTALYWALQEYNVVGAISFNYHQRHNIELQYAKKTCETLGIEHRVQIVDIYDQRSSLKNKDIDVPHGHYEEETMKATVVNNRNSIMFSLATAWAIDKQANRIVVGIHSGDHAVYPDCRTDYIKKFNETMRLANEGFLPKDFAIVAPFVEISKTDIAELGLLIGLDESKTYSDYEGGEVQVAKSGTSVERIEAISEAYHRINMLTAPYVHAHKQDRTEYKEKDFALELLINNAKIKRRDEILNIIRSFINRTFFK